MNHTVPCRPLSDMLRIAGLSKIHFFSLDVEGAEALVLRTFDWNVPVHVWIVETSADAKLRGAAGGDVKKHAEIVDLMGSHGYVVEEALTARVGHNTVFVHHELAGTVARRVDECGGPRVMRAPPHAHANSTELSHHGLQLHVDGTADDSVAGAA